MESISPPRPSNEDAQTSRSEQSRPSDSVTESIEEASSHHDWRFWSVIAMLCVIDFAAALDNTIIFTALPSITREIGGDSQYVWIANAYVLTSAAIQPLVGQLCNIFGRKILFMTSIVFFALGAGISGGASSPAMLISGRAIQGLGCGGIFVLTDLIVCDITSQRERGMYLGIVLAVAGIGSTLGPLIGGALVEASWRWVFYITLPFSGITLITSAAFLRLKYHRVRHWKHALARVDIVGNALFIASIISICLGLILGVYVYSWSSWRVIVPLVLGFAGWILFHIFEASPLCREHTMPPRLFSNRTSLVGFIMTFIMGMEVEWLTYMLPLYFQAVKHTSPFHSAVDTLAFVALLMPFGIVGGGLLAKTGKYRPLHAAGFALCAVGTGLLSATDRSTKTVEWIFWQLFASAGLGMTFTTILPSILASLSQSDVASATATYSFMRSFGMIWGIVVPSVIFSSRMTQSLHEMNDSTLNGLLGDGKAYQAATEGALRQLPANLLQRADSAYAKSLSAVWYGAMGFSLLGVILAFAERHYDLATDVNGEFGIEREKKVDVERLSPGKA